LNGTLKALPEPFFDKNTKMLFRVRHFGCHIGKEMTKKAGLSKKALRSINVVYHLSQ
jgi:hypothetical protein